MMNSISHKIAWYSGCDQKFQTIITPHKCSRAEYQKVRYSDPFCNKMTGLIWITAIQIIQSTENFRIDLISWQFHCSFLSITRHQGCGYRRTLCNQINIKTYSMNEIFNSGLKSPNFQSNFHGFVGAHDGISLFPPIWKRQRTFSDHLNTGNKKKLNYLNVDSDRLSDPH